MESSGRIGQDESVTHTGSVVDTKDGYDVLDCERCGFKHLMPIPSAASLDEVYRNQFYEDYTPSYIARQEEDLAWWTEVYRDRLSTLASIVHAQPRRILEVGAGAGMFLAEAKRLGWECLGVEPSHVACEYGRQLGIEVIEDFLTPEVAARVGTFDAIHMQHVLEHIPDPHALLGLMRGMLNPGGVICIVVPNDYSPFQKAVRDACALEPWWLSAPYHINYFDFESTRLLLASTGLDVVAEDASFPIDMFLLMGDRYVGDDALGRQCHSKRMQFELNLVKANMGETRRQLYRAFASVGIGRDVIMFAQARTPMGRHTP